MELESLSKGTYVIGVSGGVDSIVLLHALQQHADVILIVAHFDHGIRNDSAEDSLFVNEIAQMYQLLFISERVELGTNASEALARTKRYEFLNAVKEKYEARAIITAHHQDDVIETAILNMVRGTKRRGFVSLQSNEQLIRPLLKTTKADILSYAHQHALQWREDSTNSDTRYHRNRVRKIIKKSLNAENRSRVMALLKDINDQNNQINLATNELLKSQPLGEINKNLINRMQLAEAYEVAAAWLRINGVVFDETTIKRLVIGARTLENTAQIDLKDGYYSVVKRDKIVIARR